MGSMTSKGKREKINKNLGTWTEKKKEACKDQCCGFGSA